MRNPATAVKSGAPDFRDDLLKRRREKRQLMQVPQEFLPQPATH
jgi:hypothetical protein